MASEVTVFVPATTANLGPGFDCLGLALNLHNRITFQSKSEGISISVRGEGEELIPRDRSNLVLRAAEVAFEHIGRRPPGLHIDLENHIPIYSGLGSSAAAVLGGIVAANSLVDGDLEKDELLTIATNVEGHPDNVTPAMYGGLTLSFMDGEDFIVEQLTVPQMEVVFVLPEIRLATIKARAALPDKVPLSDAVYNMGRLGLLITALAAADFGKLSLAMKDRLHQPFRQSLIPGLNEVFGAGKRAGAAGVVISGAGPGVVAFASDHHSLIAESMVRAFADSGLASRSWVLSIDKYGSYLADFKE